MSLSIHFGQLVQSLPILHSRWVHCVKNLNCVNCEAGLILVNTSTLTEKTDPLISFKNVSQEQHNHNYSVIYVCYNFVSMLELKDV